MKYLKDQPLSSYSSMKLGGKAKFLCHAKSQKDFIEALTFAHKNNLNLITIGDGTNIIFTDSGFNGLVVVNKYIGFKLENETIIAKSGTKWDEIVKTSVANNLTGIEALSLVPGTVGGAPVNNIGAYGQEIKDTLLYVTALDKTTGKILKLSKDFCSFSYRNSIFKAKQYGRYQILEVALGLSKYQKKYYTPPDYPAVRQALKNNKPNDPSTIRDIIISIRKSKLPDPKIEPNTGSFFKNPIINKKIFNKLIEQYPNATYYQLDDDNYKIPAGWLIDSLGLKGQVINGIEIYAKQALVLVNRTAISFKELELTIKYIQDAVSSKYGIKLLIEPEIIYND